MLRDEVEFPPGELRAAIAIVQPPVVLVALSQRGNSPDPAPFQSFMPILAALFAAEHMTGIALAQAANAREMVVRFEALAMAVEAARAEASSLNAELRSQDRQKDEFLAMLGHELRNPLAALTNAVTLLGRKGVPQALLTRLVDGMSRQVGQLSRLVNDLLDVSRVSRGRIHLQPAEWSLAEVLSDSLQEIDPLVRERHHKVIEDIDPLLMVFADRLRLLQIFGNLLSNAAKYTPEGGTLRLKSVRRDNEVLVELRDDGIGIAAEVLPKVFDLFAQAPESLSQARGGLGIGLTLVKRLVELHGGRIDLASDGLNCGTTVRVWLPLHTAAPVDSGRQVAGVAATGSTRQLRVLIVDDNKDAADTLQHLLEGSGHSVVSVYGAYDALEMAASEKFDLILLDIGLPVMNGAEVARRLRTSGVSVGRIVAVSGFGEVIPNRDADVVHFDERFVKPVSFDALQDLLRRTGAAKT
ncbi:MAG: hybrid sensor histidine kinase/response regulator [Steroidobacteraceae bacterium]